jgi:hypothetical protein
MSKVKFNVNTEYAYLQNFKILQSEMPAFLPGTFVSLIAQTLFQIASPNTKSSDRYRSNHSSNAKCRTTLNFCNGQNDIGTSITLAVSTTPLHAGKAREPLPQGDPLRLS